MNGAAFAIACALAVASCTAQASTVSTPADRAEVEARVRACGFPMRQVRWTRVEGLGQWELGFETDATEMGATSPAALCVDRVGDDLISPRRLDVAIGYSASAEAAR